MDMQGSESGHVSPIANCPHVQEFVHETDNIDTTTPCTICNDTTENWICLTCYATGCCRFKGAHALKHFETTNHPIALSFSDLSIWCYSCENYIRNPRLSSIFQMAHKDKFQVHPGKTTSFIISNTGNLTEEELTEYFDTPEELSVKVKQLAEIMRGSAHMVVYTGAGVSTSAKIPDYRGPQGVWTLQEKGMQPQFDVTIEQALPTISHMALVELLEKNIMKFLSSTNVDGLHRRSGIPEKKMTEFHGNCYKELCSSCAKEYLRNFDASSHRGDHRTGRKCDDCGSHLIDSIINFGENLPQNELEKAAFEANKSDLSLVLGTSMRVSPANKFPLQAVANGGKMVIVNLQKTPYDRKAHLVIHERTDKVMQMLMEELGLTIPEYHINEDLVKNPKQ